MKSMESLLDQVATRQRTTLFLSADLPLPNPDPILRKMGRSIDVYRNLLADSQVGGCVRRRKAAVKALPWRLVQGSAKRRTFDMIDGLLKSLNLQDVFGEMLDATLFGYQPMEVSWAVSGGLIVPVSILGKPPEWFIFDGDNQLRLITIENPLGELLPDKKFLLPRQNPTYQNPYGMPDLSMVFWPATFKHGGMEFWVKFTEKYGSPWLVGKQPRGTPRSETDELLECLDGMVQDAVSVIPDDSSIQIIESGGKSGSVDIYERFLRYCRSEIAIALLGQNQTTESDSNRASATAGLEVAKEIRDADATILASAMKTLIDWICELNTNDSGRPVFEFYEPDDLKKLAERDKLLREAGAEFSADYFVRTYGLSKNDVVQKTSGSAQHGGASFAEADANSLASFVDQDAVDRMGDAAVGNSQLLANALLQSVIGMINAASDYNEAIDGLAKVFPKMDIAELQVTLAQAMFVAEQWGYANGEI